ncbi:hypothetical protein OUZ56_015018 [Daphnia magna]|uniref:Uncharacterized protein n=1 Tax=Daphnia magna TaxID=35525 RepID=A0ABR0ALL9_9CRUS|nr:hypothetical protein OUZ56_015018 [Daphnia magna]
MQALDNNKTSRWVSWHERDQSASIHYVDGSRNWSCLMEFQYNTRHLRLIFIQVLRIQGHKSGRNRGNDDHLIFSRIYKFSASVLLFRFTFAENQNHNSPIDHILLRT